MKSWKPEKHLRMIPWLRKNDQDIVSRSNLRNEPYLVTNLIFTIIILFIIAYAVNSLGARIVLQIKTSSSVKAKNNKKRMFIFRIVSKISILILGFFKEIINIIKKVIRKIKKSKQLTLKRRYQKQKIGIALIAGSILFSVIFLILLLYFF